MYHYLFFWRIECFSYVLQFSSESLKFSQNVVRILDQILTLEFLDYQKGFWDLRFDPTLVYTYMNPQATVVFSKNGLLAKWYA